ncbi:MAG: hypothetical protein WCY36_07400 [Candidatus Omnitrophota bacterium]
MNWKIVGIIGAIFLVASLIAGAFWIGYEKGKTKGYSLASKDRATQSYEAQTMTVANAYVYTTRRAFSLFSWGTWSLISKDVREAVPVATQNISSGYNSTAVAPKKIEVKK